VRAAKWIIIIIIIIILQLRANERTWAYADTIRDLILRRRASDFKREQL